MKLTVKVKLPSETVKVVGTFDNEVDATRCAKQWREDRRLKGQKVTIEKEGV